MRRGHSEEMPALWRGSEQSTEQGIFSLDNGLLGQWLGSVVITAIIPLTVNTMYIPGHDLFLTFRNVSVNLTPSCHNLCYP